MLITYTLLLLVAKLAFRPIARVQAPMQHIVALTRLTKFLASLRVFVTTVAKSDWNLTVAKFTPYWTKERCENLANQCATLKEFRTKHRTAYAVCINKKWKEELLGHLSIAKKPNNFWSNEMLIEIVKKYETIDSLRKGDNSAYSMICKRGLHDKMRDTLESKKLPNGHFSKERCSEIALSFSTRGEFFRLANSAYNAARKNKWLQEICGHMKRAKIASDMDVFYVIAPSEMTDYDFPVKFGITSKRRFGVRLKESAKLIVCAKVYLSQETNIAKEIETAMLRQFKRKPAGSDKSINGHSEVRLMRLDEFEGAMNEIRDLLKA